MGAAPDGATLTALYLGELARSRASARDLAAGAASADLVVNGQCLSRPLFLGRRESRTVHSRVEHLRTALLSLPERLYGGDLGAFAAGIGLTQTQASTLIRGVPSPATRLTRADLYLGGTGFRVLEFNVGSAVAGVDNSDLCRAMLRHPLLAAFAREHDLGYADTQQHVIDLIFTETGAPAGSFPLVAITDWPEHYQRNRAYLHRLAARWCGLGLDADACHVGELGTHGGRVWLRGRPVDIIYRLFVLEHLLAQDGPALIGPVLEAAARGEVAMFTPLDTEMYGSKAALAMLSDPANRHLFTPAEQAAIDTLLPWTRLVRPGPVTLPDGSTADLLGYATSHASDLVLKPALLHGGLGVLAGWQAGISARQWRDALAGAMGGHYVIQWRVHPHSELCPDEGGELVPWTVTWGFFTVGTGYSGVWARAFPTGSGRVVQVVNTGAFVGCCLCAGQGGH